VGPCVKYLIAGGDKALIVGDELPEDDPPRGQGVHVLCFISSTVESHTLINPTIENISV